MRRKVQLTQAESELHQAAISGDLNAVIEAIAAGVNVNSQDEEHYTTPLLWACAFNHVAVVKALVEARADVNYADENSDTPLHNSLSQGKPSLEIIRFLLSRGANMYAKDGSGYSMLDAVVSYENLDESVRRELIDLLIENGYDVNHRNQNLNGCTPLMLAVAAASESGETQGVSYLLEKGADPDAIDDVGQRVLDYAEGERYKDVYRILQP